MCPIRQSIDEHCWPRREGTQPHLLRSACWGTPAPRPQAAALRILPSVLLWTALRKHLSAAPLPPLRLLIRSAPLPPEPAEALHDDGTALSAMPSCPLLLGL